MFVRSYNVGCLGICIAKQQRYSVNWGIEGERLYSQSLTKPRRNQKPARSWIRIRLPKGQLNIPEEKKIGNNQALVRRQKWPKTIESGRGGVAWQHRGLWSLSPEFKSRPRPHPTV
jgi:hypothetical protein